MSKQELNELIEKLIAIRDWYKGTMTRDELDAIADACNVIEHNIDALSIDTYTVEATWI